MVEAYGAVVIVVGAAIVRGGRLLAVERAAPPELAGLWEFPGGKVEPGESEPAALARECREELGLEVEVGDRVGPDAPIATGTLRVYAARTVAGELALAGHSAARWLGPAELDDVAWIPADRPVVEAVRSLLDSRETGT